MLNKENIPKNTLPSYSQLIKSTIFATGITIILFLCVIIPAEYGKDPTGIGELIGIKKMGEIKMNLKMEDLKNTHSPNMDINLNDIMIREVDDTSEKKDDVEFTIEPDGSIEIKLIMVKGALVKYSWKTKNGGLNFNLHGDGYRGSNKSITYKKGRMKSYDSGEIVSEFDGYHGWFWRNRNNVKVNVVLEIVGDYIELKKIK